MGTKSQAQSPRFDSGSTGHEGALNITKAGETYFDPVAMKLNPVVPGVFHFTTINIAAGSILKLTENVYHGPAYFLASGDVTIAGQINLDGEPGACGPTFPSQRTPTVAGSGGFSGGIGGNATTNPPLSGNGPGGGKEGTAGQNNASGGSNTANQYLTPLVGGSGGGGAVGNPFGGMGGAGGGALLLASTTAIKLDGVIGANGGNNGSCGGGGAGGSVLLVSNAVSGIGAIKVMGGPGYVGGASSGKNGFARMETYTGGVGCEGNCIRETPSELHLPQTGPPTITVTKINNEVINSNPFTLPPDKVINTSAPVRVEISAHQIPLNTIPKIYLFPETGPDRVVDIGPLKGTLADSMAIADVTFPPGGTRGYVKATW